MSEAVRTTDASSSQRADAVRNRRLVQAAAVEVFAEYGINATVADVAERAGVGNATVYRAYGAKSSLLAEVSIRWLSQMEVAAAQIEAHSDGVEAFRELIFELFTRLHNDRLAVDLLRAGDLTDEVATVRHRVEAHVTAMLHAGQRDGAIRADVTYGDLHVLIMGVAGRLSDMGVTEPSEWRRMAEIVLSGLSLPQR
jgi:AcrR family transcriptional regulator